MQYPVPTLAHLYYAYTAYEKQVLIGKEGLLKFGVQEWSNLPSRNLCFGCSADCCYCYAASAARFHKKLKDWNTWSKMIFLPKWLNITYQPIGFDNCLMFPTTHNIPSEEPEIRAGCIKFISKMVCEKQVRVLVTLKPHLDVIREICDRFDVNRLEWPLKKKVRVIENPKQYVGFRFTIGSLNARKLAIMEPHAPPFEERLAALELARDRGFRVSVSAEPLLDEDLPALVDFLTSRLGACEKKRDEGTIWVGPLHPYWSVEQVREKYGEPCANLYEETLSFSRYDHVKEYYRLFYNHPRIQFKQSVKKMMVLHEIRVPEIEKIPIQDKENEKGAT